MSSNDDREQRHNQRMARKKEVVDAAIAAATDKRGVLVVNTGNGKGKSSAAFGMVARALGHGQRVAVVQFIKGRSDTGEEAFFQQYALQQPERLVWQVCGEGFTWETQDLARDQATAAAAWQVALRYLSDPAYDLVVLDELTYLFKYRWLDLDAAIASLQARPPLQHVAITGRAAPEALIAAADTVSEINVVKHAFKAGIAAQPGVDY
jgi:cob(I)alamin adenosyltransferase